MAEYRNIHQQRRLQASLASQFLPAMLLLLRNHDQRLHNSCNTEDRGWRSRLVAGSDCLTAHVQEELHWCHLLSAEGMKHHKCKVQSAKVGICLLSSWSIMQ